MQSTKRPDYLPLTVPSPAELFSAMELFHENSKLQPSDYELFANVAAVNTSPEIRRSITRPFMNYPGHRAVPLPKDFPPTSRSFESILCNRRSEHKFSGQPIELSDLARVLFLGDGIVTKMAVDKDNEFSMRTAPSGGGLYPIEMYPIALRVNDLAPGSYFLNPLPPQLELLKESDFAAELADSTAVKEEMHGAAACIVLVGVLPRSSFKYGQRAYRFLLLEAGHIAQNLLLAAESMGLGALPLGGFTDDRINRLLSLDGCNEFAIYLVLIGNKARPA